MAARVFRLWPRHVLDDLAAGVDEALRAWALDWGVPAMRTAAAAAMDGATLQQHTGGPALPVAVAAGTWLAGTQGIEAELAAVLFGAQNAGAGGTMAARAAAACRVDLIERLAAMPGGSHAGAPDDHVAEPSALLQMARAGSGAVRIDLVVGERQLVLLCDGAAVARLAPGRPPPLGTLPPRDLPAALADHRVTLELRMTPTRLALGELATLAVGDVVALDHRLDLPLVLATPAGSAVGSARLVPHPERRVVALEG